MSKNSLAKRNMGLDILKCLSMLGVVVLHCLGQGGVLGTVEPLSVNFNVAWFLEIACLYSVNTFGIITGYFSLKSQHKWNRLFDMWGAVFFYSLLFAIISFFVNKTSIVDLITNSLPVSKGIHWYFNAYIFVWLFTPYINKLILSLNKKQHLSLILIALTLFSFHYLISCILKSDPFVIKSGYSPIWLLTLYFIGAYLNLYKINFIKTKRVVYVAVFFACTIASWISNFVLTYIGGDIATTLATTLKTYPSPLLVTGATSLFILFFYLEINHCKKFIATISASSFFVYIIHTNPFFSSFLSNSLSFLSDKPWYILLGGVIGTAIAIYIVCTVIDILRQKFFALMHIEKLYNFIIKILSKIFLSVRNCILDRI